MKTSNIHFVVETDENRVPEKISWSATDKPEISEAGAVILSVWDRKQQTALRIDLWDKEMDVQDMKQLVHQTMLTLADSFERATGEKAMSASMRDFCEYFADKMNLRSPI